MTDGDAKAENGRNYWKFGLAEDAFTCWATLRRDGFSRSEERRVGKECPV